MGSIIEERREAFKRLRVTGVVIPRRLGSGAKQVAQLIMERAKDAWRSVSRRPCESPDVVIVSLWATHRVAPTTLDVKGIVSAIFTTPRVTCSTIVNLTTEVSATK